MLLGKIKEKISRMWIKQKILMLISLFGFMIIATYTILSYLDARSSIYKSIDDRILAGSFAVHFAVGDEFHDSNWDSLSIPEEKHLENIRQLNRVCKRLGLIYVYTMVMKNDSVFFTSSSATDEELEKKSYSPYLDTYPEASDVLKITFSDNKEKFEEYADRWGNFRSGFIPFTTSRGHTYIVGADISIGEVNSQLLKALLKNIIIGLIIYAGFFLVSYIVAGRIARPIHKLAEDARLIAGGKYDIEIKVPTQDETRLLGDALSALAANVKLAFETLEAEKAGVERKVVEAIKEIEGQKVYLEKSVETMLGAMGRFSEGDLTVALKIENNDDIGRMYTGFNKTVDDFRAVVRQVSTSVFETASASRQISSSTEEMAAGGQEQITEATKISGAVEEMTKTIFDNTKNAAQAAARAREVGDKAREGGNVVLETVEGMNKIAEVVTRSAVTIRDLGQSSSQIGEIIEVINDIADQTNLLALNAAIEAARAGEQGRGFAVVADEVRKLAERTSHATQEIASMIKLIQRNTGGAVEAIEQGTREVEKGKALAGKAGEALKEIIEGTSEVTDLIGQLASASEEQSATSDEISRNIESITTVTRQSAAGIEQIARAAEDLRNLTETLQALISHFHIGEGSAAERQGMLVSR